MARPVNDPRVVEVFAAFDRFVASPERATNDTLLCGFMCSVVNTVIDRFTIPCDWPPEALRSVLVAFLVNAPAVDFENMLGYAREEAKWIAEFEAESAWERIHDTRYPGVAALAEAN